MQGVNSLKLEYGARRCKGVYEIEFAEIPEYDPYLHFSL